MNKPNIVISLNTRENPVLVEQIEQICSDSKYPDPTWVDSYIDVLALAIKERRDGQQVKVIGRFDELGKEWSGDDAPLFIEVTLLLLEEHNIAFEALDEKGSQINKAVVSLPRQLIRQFKTIYDETLKQLEPRIRSLELPDQKRARKYGRPPYGYHQRRGRLVVDKEQAAAVRTIIYCVRERKSAGDVLDEVKNQHAKINGKKQFWDYRKLHRIMNNIRIYCLGEYEAGGSVVTMPQLAFLPAEWATTRWPTTSTIKE